jgi:hypothetical protein
MELLVKQDNIRNNTISYLQSTVSFNKNQRLHSSKMGSIKFFSDKIHLHMRASSARSTDRTRLRDLKPPNPNHSSNNLPHEQNMSTPFPIHEPPKPSGNTNTSSSPTHPHHQVTRSISEVGSKLHRNHPHHGHHHHPHLHRKDKDKGEGVLQIAGGGGGPSLQPSVSRSEPNESRDVSQGTSVFEVPVDERRRVVGDNEVGEERERGSVRATFVFPSLSSNI